MKTLTLKWFWFNHRTAKLVFEHAKLAGMTAEGFLWLISSGAGGTFKTWHIADEFPVGIFGRV